MFISLIRSYRWIFLKLLKLGGKVIKFYEAVNYRGNFIISPFRKTIDKLFTLKQNYEEEGNDSMQGLVKLIRKSVDEIQIRKDIHEFYKCKPEHWMQTENDDNVLDYWKLP